MTTGVVGVVSWAARAVPGLGRSRRIALVACAALSVSTVVLAQQPGRLFIRNVTMDGAGTVLTIIGARFGPSPQIAFDGEPVAALPGATDTQISIAMPGALLTTRGSYRLSVFDPVSQTGEAFIMASRGDTVVVHGPEAGDLAARGSQPAPQSRNMRVTTDSDTGTVVAAMVEQSTFPHKTSLGYNTLVNNISVPTADPVEGDHNTAIGFQAMQFNTTGGFNTAVGGHALYKNISGSFNTALGLAALSENISGVGNTASGEWALYWNTTGSGNTANGLDALVFNTTGSYNTGIGRQANQSNTTGDFNTSLGTQALYTNTTGAYNTAVGAGAMYYNTTGIYNTASGLKALYVNTTGSYNAADGYQALYANTTGHDNTSAGYASLLSTTTGSFNTAVGRGAGMLATSGHYNIYLGADVFGTAGDSNAIRIGSPYNGSTGQFQTFIAGIRGTSVSGGVPVVVDAEGRLGTSGGVGGSLLTAFDASNTQPFQLRLGYISGQADYGIGRNPADGFLHFTGTQPSFSGFTFDTFNAPGAVTIANNGVMSVLDSTNTRPFQLRVGFRPDIDYGIGRNPSDGFLNFTGTQPTFSGFRFNTANVTSALSISNTGNVGLGVAAPTRPLEAANGAFLSAGGVWTNASSRSLKNHIEPVSAAVALDVVSRLEPVTFVYTANSTDMQVGFIAEDVPDLVASEDRRGLSSMDIVAVVTKAVQVQQQQLQVQEKLLRDQDAIIADLQARLARLETRLARKPN